MLCSVVLCCVELQCMFLSLSAFVFMRSSVDAVINVVDVEVRTNGEVLPTFLLIKGIQASTPLFVFLLFL